MSPCTRAGFVLALIAAGIGPYAHAAIPASEHDALISLYVGTNGANWTNNTGWHVSPPDGTECSWYGVTCDQTMSNVIGISLENNNLTGSLTELDRLTKLSAFLVTQNHLTGGFPTLNGLTNLSTFYAGRNQIQGQIPTLQGLTNLAYFDVSSNQLSGAIPPLTGLTKLVYFTATNNGLSGQIPSLSGLTELVTIGLYSNRLSGPMPPLAGLTNLTNVYLFDNQLSGPIPPLAGLTKLSDFWVGGNGLSGPIPPLSGLTSLSRLYANSNQLTGAIPSLSGLSRLTELIVSDNQLTGQMPPPPVVNQLAAGRTSLCPNGLEHLDDTGWDAATGQVPWWQNCVPTGPLQFGGTPYAGQQVTFTATAGATRYEWDIDGDDVVDRSSSSNTLAVTYPGAFDGLIAVTTTSGSGVRTTTKQPLAILAPHLVVTVTGPPTELCGNGDGIAQAGKRFSVPIRVTNVGFRPMVDGYATFVAQDRVLAASNGAGIAGKLAVETPLVGVGDLAPVSSVNAQAVVTLASDAACGGSYGLLFRGGVDTLSSGPGQTSAIASFNVPAGAQCAPYTGSCSNLPKALVTPRQGLYLNSNRSGNGLSNFVIPVNGSAAVYFGAWFTGAADHNPTWYIIQAPIVGNVAVGPILRFTQDPSAATFTVQSTVVGTAVVTLKSAERIAFIWQIGDSSGIELMDYFVGGSVPAPNRTGAWFNTGESGWGQVVHSYVSGGQNNLFVVDYIYDNVGQPRWVLGQAAGDSFATATPHQAFQVHCPGCPWIADWNNFPIAAGTGTETFIDAASGRVTTSFVLPAAFGGSWVRVNLPISLLTPPQ